MAEGIERIDRGLRRRGVDRVERFPRGIGPLGRILGIDLVRGNDFQPIKTDQGDVAELGAGREIVTGVDREADKTLADAGAVLGREESRAGRSAAGTSRD